MNNDKGHGSNFDQSCRSRASVRTSPQLNELAKYMIGIGQELGQARQKKHSPHRALEMTDGSTRIALETLDALESRLQRVNWYLSGDNEEGEVLQNVKAEGRDQTVQARLARLENDLGKLSSRSHEVRELLNLYSKYPDLFQSTTSDMPSTLSTAEILAIITACATSYPTTASRLNAIQDLQIPAVDASASLIALHPRLAKVELLQESQAREMGLLRIKTASAIQRWYELGVLGEGECWSEWESRAVNAEKRVRRAEIEQAQEAKENEAYQP